MRRTSRRPWTRPLQAERNGHTHTRLDAAGKGNTLDLSSQLESLEKKASETAASVKAAAAEDRAQLKQRFKRRLRRADRSDDCTVERSMVGRFVDVTRT